MQGPALHAYVKDACLVCWLGRRHACMQARPGHYTFLLPLPAPDSHTLFSARSNERLFLLNGHIDEIAAHQFDATRLASAALNGHVRLWDMRSGKSTAVLEHDAPVHAFQFEGDRLVSGTWDGRVCLWDLRRNALVQEWETHNERVWAVAMDRFRLVSAGLDHALTVRSFAPEDVAFHGWGGAGGGATGCGGAGGGAGGGASGGTGEGGSRAAEAPAP